MSRRSVLDIYEAAADAITLGDLNEGALASICGAVGVDSSLLFRFGPVGEPCGVGGELQSQLGSYAEDLYELDPLQQELATIPPRAPTVPTSEMVNQRRFLNSGAYHEFYAPNGIHHLIALWISDLPYGAPGMTGLLLCRGRRSSPFGDREAGFLRRIYPALNGVYRRHLRQQSRDRRHDHLMSILAGSANPRVLLLDERLSVLFVSEQGARSLARCDGYNGPLPPSILAKAADHIARFKLRLRVEAARFEVPEGDGLMAWLECRALDGARPMVVVRFDDRQAALEGLRRLIAERGVTKAEGRVLECLAEGMTNQQIATRLFVSLDTVKTHVRRVLAKLAVSSRTHAALLASEAMNDS